MDDHLRQYLEPTFYLNHDHAVVAGFAAEVCAGIVPAREQAVALYYAVRDRIRYDPYDLRYVPESIQASAIIEKGSGYCVAKAIVLAAVARHQGIPSRLGFADVTNHLSTERLRKKMGTDLFIYHGYTELLLDNKWVKATPAFNLSLCTRFDVRPLEFDGREDSIFHEFDARGRRHMVYVREHGHFADLPFDLIFQAYQKTYPLFFNDSSAAENGDFAADAAAERQASDHC